MTIDLVRLHKECEMQDILGLVYVRLNDEGYHGDFNDEKTNQLEKTLHDTYHAVLRGAAQIGDFEIFADKYFCYLKKNSRKG